MASPHSQNKNRVTAEFCKDSGFASETPTEVLTSECRQVAARLGELAAMCRTQESKLRNLVVSLSRSSVSAGDRPTVQVGADDQNLTISFSTFGKFRVEIEGSCIEITGKDKAFKILKLLVQRRCPSTREMLIETLWPESEPVAASNRLRVEFHTLRQIFLTKANLPNLIVFHSGCYELNPEILVQVDADEFEALWHLGVKFESDGCILEAKRSYEQAVLLYRGDYLEEHPFEEWTLLRRESLRDGFLYLLGKLAGWCYEEDDHGGCIAYCHKILAQDPYREDAYRLLMRCYTALGQKASALHWYNICSANLQKGLDVSPSDETRRLLSQITAASD